MRLWHAPLECTTEVATSVSPVTAAAQWNELAMRPLVLWEMMLSHAEIAAILCDQAAINAGNQTWITRRELLQGHLIELNTDFS